MTFRVRGQIQKISDALKAIPGNDLKYDFS